MARQRREWAGTWKRQCPWGHLLSESLNRRDDREWSGPDEGPVRAKWLVKVLG